MSDIRRIDIREFRELGWVHEINRLLLHPAGLALEVETISCAACNGNGKRGDKHERCETCGATGQVEILGGVWDYRDDPEGMLFGDDLLSAEKAKRIATLLEERRAARIERCGYFVQPVDEGTTP
jgi:hypothetical protein